MKLKHLFESTGLDYGEAPKRPKVVPEYYDELSIPDQRLWIKLNSLMGSADKKAGTKFKIKVYHSPGASQGTFHGKGRVSKDDFVQDIYIIEALVTDFMFKIARQSVTGRKSYLLWSYDGGFVNLERVEPDSYANRIGPGQTKSVFAGSLKLNSLKGMPDSLEECNVSRNTLGTIDEFPRHCKTLTAINCGITTLKDIHKKLDYCEKLYLAENPIKSNVLGLLKVNGLKEISLGGFVNKTDSDLRSIAQIIQKYLSNGGDIMDCQDELIDAGFGDYAKL